MVDIPSEKIDRQLLESTNHDLLNSNMSLFREVIETHEKYRGHAKDYVNQIIVTLGVVAGFGFTSLNHVTNPYLFVFGEAFLFSAIVVGFHFIRKYFIKPLDLMSQWVDGLKEIQKVRVAIVPGLPDQEALRVYKHARKLEEDLAEKTAEVDKGKTDYLRIINILFIFGCISILLSLLDINQLI